MKKSFIYGLFAIALASCSNNKEEKKANLQTNNQVEGFETTLEKARQIFKIPPNIAKNSKNPITEEKVALGKMLYFNNRLSKDNTQSCNTCHNLNTFGVDNNSFSKGNDGGLGGRNSPTTLNAALHLAQFWDGREPDVEAQAGDPILNPVEMAMPSKAAVVSKLSKIREYRELFKKAFPEEKSPITYDNLQKAIGTFERELITFSKFDDFLSGDDNALSQKEKKGLHTFINAGCTTCHSGDVIGGKMYQKFGLFDDYWKHTKSTKIDNGKFDVIPV